MRLFCLAAGTKSLWRGKTVQAGSMNVAGYFTGEEYAKGTSVGLGQVMELYGNYKRWGVLVGFFLLGWLISIWDIRCGQALRQGDWRNYSCYFILLVPLLQPGGSAVELFSGTAAAAVLVWFLKKYVFKEEGKKAKGSKRVVSDSGSRIQDSGSLEIVERPKRFVYGGNSKKNIRT